MLTAIIILIGASFGYFIYSLLKASSRADDVAERIYFYLTDQK